MPNGSSEKWYMYRKSPLFSDIQTIAIILAHGYKTFFMLNYTEHKVLNY